MSWLFFWRPPCLLRRVMLVFAHDSDEAIEGLLWGYRGRWLVLKDVAAIKSGFPPKPLPGEVTVHRSNVAYLQVLS
jgi:hypothetical protein